MQVAARLRPMLRRGRLELTLAGAFEMTDSDRFEAFVREYQDMVFATAVRLLANPAEAEDIAQTVFLRAFERFASIEASATVAGWLKTVTTNLCLNHLARYRARWQFFSELDRPDSDERYEATVPAPMGRDETEEASRQVYAQIVQDCQKDVLQTIYIFGCFPGLHKAAEHPVERDIRLVGADRLQLLRVEQLITQRLVQQRGDAAQVAHV